MRKVDVLQILMSLILVPLLVTVGCQEQLDSFSDSPEKGNPKLDSRLNQLVLAEMQGEAAQFAEQNDIELLNDGVRVIIECLPGQDEYAAEAANAVGIVEARHDNLLQAVVPLTSLNSLADEETIHFIRLPQEPVPDSS